MQIEFPWSETHEMNLQIQALTSGNACRRSYSVLPSRFGGSLDELRFLYVTYMDKQWKKRNATWHLTLISSHLIVITSSPHHSFTETHSRHSGKRAAKDSGSIFLSRFVCIFVSLYMTSTALRRDWSVFAWSYRKSDCALCEETWQDMRTASLIHRRLPTRRVNVMPLY